jgi:hypothetical protein
MTQNKMLIFAGTLLVVPLSAYMFLGGLPVIIQPPEPRVMKRPAAARPAVDRSTSMLIGSLWRAVCRVESRGDPKAYNAAEQAAGIAQIRPICLRDCNRIVELVGGPADLWTMTDRYDARKSREMFAVYVTYYHPEPDAEAWARIWNGGPKMRGTDRYWRLVSEAMNK